MNLETLIGPETAGVNHSEDSVTVTESKPPSPDQTSLRGVAVAVRPVQKCSGGTPRKNFGCKSPQESLNRKEGSGASVVHGSLPSLVPAEIADYTTRSNYQKNYARENRAAINARKRAWRNRRRFLKKSVARCLPL